MIRGGINVFPRIGEEKILSHLKLILFLEIK